MDKNKTCFLICPIGTEDSETRKRSDKLSTFLLKPILEKVNYNLIRADKIKKNDKIDETIIDQIKNADLIIVDITDTNPNVFYELGYSTALNKTVIQISDGNSSNIPFDISTTRTYSYDFDVEKASKFKNDILSVIENIKDTENIQKTITNKETNENSFNESLISMTNYLEKLDKSYRFLEEISVKNNQLITDINRQLTSSKPNDNDKFAYKIIEQLFSQPDGIQKFITLNNLVTSQKNDSNEFMASNV